MGEMIQFEQFLGAKIEMREACEPADVIWENYSYTKKNSN